MKNNDKVNMSYIEKYRETDKSEGAFINKGNIIYMLSVLLLSKYCDRLKSWYLQLYPLNVERQNVNSVRRHNVAITLVSV